VTVWQRWLRSPEKSKVRDAFFRIHYWTALGTAAYVLVMSNDVGRGCSRQQIIPWLTRLARTCPP
jgi:hypothetical protein